MSKMKWIGVAFVALALLLQPAPRAADDEYKTSAEIRISLPDDEIPQVSISPGRSRIEIELPRGAGFPVDFASSSGGLLRDGKVTPLDEGRILLELEVAIGVLDRIDFEPQAVVLRFESRFAANGAQLSAEDQYQLGPDDEILLTVHGQEDLTSELTVTDAGTITAPLVGEVEAKGLTPRQLASRLAELLGRDYLVDPQVDIQVESFASQWVMAAGEIRLPGRVPLKGGTRLKEVLSEAGGFAEDAGEKISITRKDDQAALGYRTIDIERRAFEGGDQNPVLVHGDIITISRAEFAFVHGEVASPGRVRIERGITLLKAIASMGGFTDWANKSNVQILQGEGSKPRVFNIKKIQAGKLADPQLHGGEIIVVKRRFL